MILRLLTFKRKTDLTTYLLNLYLVSRSSFPNYKIGLILAAINQQKRTLTFRERHISVNEKIESFICSKKLKISAYTFNALGVSTILTGQSTRYPKPRKLKEWTPALLTGSLSETVEFIDKYKKIMENRVFYRASYDHSSQKLEQSKFQAN